MAAYGLGRVHSCWGVVLRVRVSWETPQHVTVFWQRFLHFTEDPAAKWICRPRPKQETGERTLGRLMFRARIQTVSLCVSEKPRKGRVFVCVCLCDCVRRSHSRQWKDTCIHTQTLAYRLFCSSICVPLAVQFEGVAHCYTALNRSQNGCFQVEWQLCHTNPPLMPSLSSTHNCTHPQTHSPTACSQARTIHNIRSQWGHREVQTGQTEHVCGLLCLEISGCLCYCHTVFSWL